MISKNCLLLILLYTATGIAQEFRMISALPKALNEASAAEVLPNSDLIWTLEDAGNKAVIYAVNTRGELVKKLKVKDVKNKDWEDLTSDKQGNLYIGDIGNNSKKRKSYTIYKITNPNSAIDQVSTERIKFSLPEGQNSLDFEAFFALGNSFYLFSKQHKKTKVFEVPNSPGEHLAKLITSYAFEGKNIRLTSAALNRKGNKIALLNHTHIWILSEFKSTQFFGGKVERFDLGHDSQKEGLCFIGSNSLLITDEFNQGKGGKLYKFTF